MSPAPVILGINFGQSYASIAVIDKEGHASCIANEEGERQIACAVSYVGEQVFIGNGAKEHLVKNGHNTIMGFRNLLGHTYDEVDHTAILTAPLIADSKTPAYTVDILVPPPTPATRTPARSAAPSGTATPIPAEPVPAKKTITAPEITTLFLQTLFGSAVDFLGEKPTHCVISAPVWFTPAQTEALREAATAAGINVIQVLDEAAAVLVGYRAGLTEERKERGLLGEPEEGTAGEEEPRDKKVVVLDMGETSLAISVVAVNEGEYTVLAKGRDDKLGGRQFDTLLLKHFAKEFTKKTKIPLDLPCGENASEQDKRAEAKLDLAIEHTKRSLSASAGAATCAVESLKDGYDLSSSINRIRFDGLAAPSVYFRVADKLRSVVAEAGLDLAQIDEVLLAGGSTLFPGLQNHLALQVPPTTPVTAALDPSEVIAVGCALQALHIAELDESKIKAADVLALARNPLPTTSAPIGIVLPGGEDIVAKVIEVGAPLPVRRRVAIPVAAGAEKVALELWYGKEEVKVEVIEPTPIEKTDDDEDDYSDDEPEEVRTAVTRKSELLGAVELKSSGKPVVLEVVVQKNGGVVVSAWEEGNEANKDGFEVDA